MVFMLASCGAFVRTPTLQPTATVLPTLTTTALPTLTETPVAIREIATVPVPSPSGYADLPDGEYILYFKDHSLEIISLDTKFQKRLIEAKEVFLSPDNQHVIFVPVNKPTPVLLNFETMAQEELPFLKDCFEITLSPNHQYFLGTCFSEERSFEIYLFSRDGNQTLQLTHCAGEHGDCSRARYSPNGEWIAYSWGVGGAFETSRVGLYLLETDCVSLTSDCQPEAKGPFEPFADFTWASDSRHLASSGSEGIAIFEVADDKVVRKIRELPGKPARLSDHYLIWSLDAQQLAYSTGNQINIVALEDGRSLDFLKFDRHPYLALLGWIQITQGKVSN